jgi:hypothetical protein
MQRMRFPLSTLTLLGVGVAPIFAQDSDWKPVGSHTSHYQAADSTGQPISLLGKPVVGGKAKLDVQLSPVSFSSNDITATPLPAPPPGRPVEYEALPFPQGVTMLKQGTGSAPVPTNPGLPAGVVNVQPLNLPPGATVVQGPVMTDGTFLPGDFGGDGFCGAGCRSDRYYLSAPHGAPGYWYGSIEYLFMSINGDKTPPLVTTGPQESNGVIGQPGVRVIYGGDLPQQDLSGARVTMGVWFNRCQTWGMFGSFFMTSDRTNTFSASSPGDPLLARPFFGTYIDLNGNLVARQLSELVAQTGVIAGQVQVDNTTRLMGADLNFRFNWCTGTSRSGRSQWNTDAYFGVKFLNLRESLSIDEDLATVNPVSHILVQDLFKTTNNFIGGNLGIMNEFRWGRFFIGTRAGLAIGATRQQVTINGVTYITMPDVAPETQPQGLLAQDSNIGNNGHNVFSIVPEFGLNFGVNITDHLRVFAGYDLTYWTNVVRPGRQIDYTINPKKLPGFIEDPNNNAGPFGPGDPNRPAFSFHNSNVLLQGFSAGLQWIF